VKCLCVFLIAKAPPLLRLLLLLLRLLHLLARRSRDKGTAEQSVALPAFNSSVDRGLPGAVDGRVIAARRAKRRRRRPLPAFPFPCKSRLGRARARYTRKVHRCCSKQPVSSLINRIYLVDSNPSHCRSCIQAGAPTIKSSRCSTAVHSPHILPAPRHLPTYLVESCPQ
jgi:hypothetical protein